MSREPKKFSIIVLDDTPSSAQLVRIILEANLPCKVHVFYSAAAMFEGAADIVPDLYFLDIVLQNESGIEVCKKLRQDPLRRDVPVIFLSAHGNPEVRVEALQAGGIDYLDKPFYPAELVVRTKAHIFLNDAKQRYREQLEEKQALLRVLCHDLKNPISVAYSYLDVLVESYDPEIAKLAHTSCRQAIELIEHVAKQSSGGAHGGEVARFNLHDALRESVSMLSPLASKKNIAVSLECDRGLEIWIDKVCFTHSIVNNLLSNAIKFSYPCSEVVVRAGAATRDGVHGIAVSVSDSGVGMPPELVQNLLAGAKILSRAGTLSEAGSGNGLRLVQRYVAQFGGRIEIDSKEGVPGSRDGQHGTKVSLFFPLP